ncbi:SIMPL domain-containing protein [Verrucomicrobium sp. BvORR106]|uniref:SIMPL domain-containing protein n=1 Tax=Verrucomicrobium sp. BvORR106 TaxID=1403819 RepID=UPI00056E9CF7|nr:SIMPL domain-containing protein [Verrucomicrobium sp. BvORR106]
MKIPFLALSLCTLLYASSAAAQQIDTQRYIEVDAVANIAADVDRASWQIKVRGEAASLAEASKGLDAATASLRDRLAKNGFKENALRLSGIASGKAYDTAREGRVFKGYYAERAAIVEIADLSRRQALETALLEDDHIEIVKVELRTSQHEELRKQALLAAVNAAREKADALAKEAGVQLGTLLTLREGAVNNGWGTLTENRIVQPFFGQNNAAEFEKLEYSATVTVKYELK